MILQLNPIFFFILPSALSVIQDNVGRRWFCWLPPGFLPSIHLFSSPKSLCLFIFSLNSLLSHSIVPFYHLARARVPQCPFSCLLCFGPNSYPSLPMELVDPFPDELSFCASKAKLVLNIGNSLSTLHTILSLPLSILMWVTWALLLKWAHLILRLGHMVLVACNR